MEYSNLCRKSASCLLLIADFHFSVIIYHDLRRSHVCRHTSCYVIHFPFSYFFCIFFFQQHKGTTKVIYREPCREESRSPHKHGRPEVSLSQRVGSLPLAHFDLLFWLSISERLNSTEVSLRLSPLCKDGVRHLSIHKAP